MPSSRINSLKIKAKLLQKAKKQTGNAIQLKEAFEILAKAAGFSSWREMKTTLDIHEIFRPARSAALWSIWYSSYEEAKDHIAHHGGYLLPYQKQFFICDQDYILNLGLDPKDPDLKLVGNNWVKPKNQSAWKRLLQKIIQANQNS